jgi:hypothetical protein
MKIVERFEDLTVGQYMAIEAKIAEKPVDTEEEPFKVIDNEIEQLAIATAINYNDLAKLPISQLKQNIKALHAILSTVELPTKVKEIVTIGPNVYFAKTDLSDLTGGQWIDIVTFAKEKSKNYNKLLACFYLPCEKKSLKPKEYDGEVHPIVAADMLNVKLKEVSGTLFFYSNLYENLIKVTKIYSDSAAKTIAPTLKEAIAWGKKNPKILKKAGLTIS